jgi:L-amino acid N-acyltransferase YncA
MATADWQRVRTIYEDGIATGNATFETTAPEWPAWGPQPGQDVLDAIVDSVLAPA